MLIKFTRDFQSKHTGERFFLAGQQIDLDGEAARAIVEEGAAVFVPLEVRSGQVEPAAPEMPPVERPEPEAPAIPRRGRPRKELL